MLLVEWANVLEQWVELCGLKTFRKTEQFRIFEKGMRAACEFIQEHSVWHFEGASTLCRRWEGFKSGLQADSDKDILRKFGRALVVFQMEAKIRNIEVTMGD